MGDAEHGICLNWAAEDIVREGDRNAFQGSFSSKPNLTKEDCDARVEADQESQQGSGQEATDDETDLPPSYSSPYSNRESSEASRERLPIYITRLCPTLPSDVVRSHSGRTSRRS